MPLGRCARWPLLIAACAQLGAAGCLTIYVPEGHVASLMHPSPVHVTPAELPSGWRLSPSLAIHPMGPLRVSPSEHSPSDVETVVWHVPRLQAGLSAIYVPSRQVAVRGEAQLGRARGESLWGMDFSLGRRGNLGNTGLEVDLGFAARKAAYYVSYSASVVNGK